MLGRRSPSPSMVSTSGATPSRAVGVLVATAATAAIVATSTLAGCSLPAPPEAGGDRGAGDEPVTTVTTASLVRVVDGDSIEVDIDGEIVDVRLLAINAPELFGPSAEGGPDTRTCNGEAAKDTLDGLLGDGPLTLVGDRTDRFGRRLASVIVDGMPVGPEMINRGWALATGDDGDRAAGFEDRSGRDRMKQAAAEGRGMWGPQCGQAAKPGPVLGEWQIDPPGPDGERLTDEWVSIVNRSESTIDLAGWVIRDHTTSNRFPLTGALRPGRTLTIRTGSGLSSDTDLHLGERFPVWSNNGETVLLVDPAGVIADRAFID